MIKICFLAHNLKQDNGAGVFASELAEGVLKHGDFSVTAIVSEGGSGKHYESLVLPKGYFNILRSFFAVRNILKRADIVHALDLFPYSYIAIFFGWGLGKKVIMTAVGSGSIIPLYSRVAWVARYCYARVHRVTAISEFTKREIQKKMPKLPIEVIHPGIDTKRWFSPSEKSVPLPERFIVSVGSLRWRKGYKYSIEAFRLIAEAFPDLEYVIVGKKYADRQYQKLMQQIQESGLTSRVHILDSIDDLDELKYIYKNAEVFILLSQNDGHDVEGFGIVFLEAASQGLPVIGSRDCGVADAMVEGENGFLVGSKDTHGAANALRRILENPELRRRMAGESLSFAGKNDWESKFGQYEKLYRSLLDSR